jgi:hypothetical protein
MGPLFFLRNQLIDVRTRSVMLKQPSLFIEPL